MNKQNPQIKQKFRSGNRLEIFFQEKHLGVTEAVAEWQEAPSSDDLEQYQILIVPRLPIALARFQRAKAAVFN